MAALSSVAAAPSALSLFLAAVARSAVPLASTSSSSTSPLAALQLGLANLLQGPASSLLDLIPPFLLAVPKSKISHSRKSMRSANKGLPEKLNITTCPGCGRAKRLHHICPACYSDITRGFKTQAKQAARAEAALASPGESSSSSNGEESLADSAWAKRRGGAIPKEEGDLLTKWMRARAGYRKHDPPVRLGQEDPAMQRTRRQQQRQKERRDDNDDEGGDGGSGFLPPGVQLA